MFYLRCFTPMVVWLSEDDVICLFGGWMDVGFSFFFLFFSALYTRVYVGGINKPKLYYCKAERS